MMDGDGRPESGMPNMDSPTKEPSSPGMSNTPGKPVDSDKSPIPVPRSWGVASDSIEQPEPAAETRAKKTDKPAEGTAERAERAISEPSPPVLPARP